LYRLLLYFENIFASSATDLAQLVDSISFNNFIKLYLVESDNFNKYQKLILKLMRCNRKEFH